MYLPFILTIHIIKNSSTLFRHSTDYFLSEKETNLIADAEHDILLTPTWRAQRKVSLLIEKPGIIGLSTIESSIVVLHNGILRRLI